MSNILIFDFNVNIIKQFSQISLYSFLHLPLFLCPAFSQNFSFISSLSIFWLNVATTFFARQ